MEQRETREFETVHKLTRLHCTFEIRLLANWVAEASWLADSGLFVPYRIGATLTAAHINMNNSKLYTTTNPHKFENWSLFRNVCKSQLVFRLLSFLLARARLSFLSFHSFCIAYTSSSFALQGIRPYFLLLFEIVLAHNYTINDEEKKNNNKSLFEKILCWATNSLALLPSASSAFQIPAIYLFISIFLSLVFYLALTNASSIPFFFSQW